MAGPPIRGQIVVLEDTPIKSLHDLRDKEVVFPSRAAFVGYHVPMDALLREKVRVSALFANNQEGAIAQLKARRAVAAAVNSEVMRDFAQRENIQYRVLWNSEPYLTIPIAAHPRVPKEQAERVSGALMALADESGGVKVLAASAKLIKQQPPFGFVRAQDADYENVRRFHKTSIVGKD